MSTDPSKKQQQSCLGHSIVCGISITSLTLTAVYCDNQVVNHIAKNSIFHEGDQYIELDCQLFQESYLMELFLFLLPLLKTNQQMWILLLPPPT